MIEIGANLIQHSLIERVERVWYGNQSILKLTMQNGTIHMIEETHPSIRDRIDYWQLIKNYVPVQIIRTEK